jgi:hypothetical protein
MIPWSGFGIEFLFSWRGILVFYFFSSFFILCGGVFKMDFYFGKEKSANRGKRCLFGISSNAKKSRKSRIRKKRIQKNLVGLVKCKVRVRKRGWGFKNFGFRKGAGAVYDKEMYVLWLCSFASLFRFCVQFLSQKLSRFYWSMDAGGENVLKVLFL